MNINSVESFEKAIQEEKIPGLDKEKTIGYLLNYGKEGRRMKRFKQILIVGLLSVLLVSSIVFGEEIATQLKKVFQIKDDSGNVQYEYGEMIEPSHIALLPELLSDKELEEIWDYWDQVTMAIEPGSIAYFIDFDTMEKTDMIIGVSRFKELESFEELQSAAKGFDFRSLGEEYPRYKFTKGSVLYKVDKEAFKSETREEYIERLRKKAEKEDSRFAYEPCKMLDEVSILTLQYSDENNNIFELSIQNLDDLGYKETSSEFDPDNIKELKVGSIDVILEQNPYANARFVIDNNRYYLYSLSRGSEEDIIKLIEALDNTL